MRKLPHDPKANASFHEEKIRGFEGLRHGFAVYQIPRRAGAFRRRIGPDDRVDGALERLRCPRAKRRLEDLCEGELFACVDQEVAREALEIAWICRGRARA
jgi:hypothetical protein